ncbi:MAG TPA: glycosyltransferase family 2 protein [Stellaceae bacterium]|nr:glycosyltransferase family 2 protein [Stellaceae bacterium]
MLDRITPIVSTYNEAPNLARTLDKLAWAKDVVLVDSASTDETLAIARRYPNVRIFQTPDPTLAGKWNFALTGTGIATDWILALDADYVVTDGLIAELRGLAPPPDLAAYRVNFVYCVHGRPLRSSIYPPDCKLLRRPGLSFVQDGHTQRAVFAGPVRALQGHILHDDRKSLSRWLWSQDRYQAAEARKLLARRVAELDVSDRIRRQAVFGPFLVFLHILFVKGLIWDGRAGLYYAFQRMAAEIILALNLLDEELHR